MPTHIVEQGECLSSLAARVGLQAPDLHNLPANAELKQKRPYPNILAPGDVVEIPDANPKWEPATIDQMNRFVMSGPKVKLRIVILDVDGNPQSGKRFVITVKGKEARGTTASNGLIECDVPADAQQGHLQVWLDDQDPEPHINRDLLIGHLDPIDMVTGVQARLVNLGYPCGVTGDLDEATLTALRRFRADNDLPVGSGSQNQDDSDSGSNSIDVDGQDTTPSSSPTEAAPGDPLGSGPVGEELLDAAVRSKLQRLYEAR